MREERFFKLNSSQNKDINLCPHFIIKSCYSLHSIKKQHIAHQEIQNLLYQD